MVRHKSRMKVMASFYCIEGIVNANHRLEQRGAWEQIPTWPSSQGACPTGKLLLSAEI